LTCWGGCGSASDGLRLLESSCCCDKR
jgi:hypothetical protein